VLLAEDSSLPCFAWQHYQENQNKHRGNEAHTNENESPLLCWGFIDPILSSQIVNLPSAICQIDRESQLNDSAILNSHTDPSRCSQKLSNRLNTTRCASHVLWEYFQVLLNAPDVAEWNTQIFSTVWSRLQNAIKSFLYGGQISELLGLRQSFPRRLQYTLSQTVREWEYITAISNSTIP
jgi:hypothetical protein